MAAEAFVHEARMTLGGFRVGASVYAIDVTQLREVVRPQDPTPLPRAPRLIEGVIELRGALVPVVDLGLALGLEPVVSAPTARIVIAQVDGLMLGLRVDQAVGVAHVEAHAMDDPPALATQAGCEMVRGIVRRPDAAPMLVLSLESVLERIYRSALLEEPV